jgi:hypothetical protein
MKKTLALIIFLLMLAPHGTADQQNEIPRNMIFMDVYIKNKATGEEISPARFDAGDRSLSECRKTAKEEAQKRYWSDWDYYCCTGTDENPCVTKVK